jgi:arginyl-tRNA synthetase
VRRYDPQQTEAPSVTLQLDPCKTYLAQAIIKILETFDGSGDLGLKPTDVFATLEKPPQDNMGDFALPCFRFAKALKLPPPKIASSLAEALAVDTSGWVAKTATVNAFCNIYVNQNKMASSIIADVLDGGAFRDPIAAANTRERVMIEYSQPNTHKEFHVGHLRNVCLGSALVKLFRYCGYQVTAANYFGDEGAHIAKCLWMMKKLGTEPGPKTDKGAWLGEIYVAATKKLDELKDMDRTAADKDISEILAGIESKKGPWYELWQKTRQWSLDAFKAVYNWVGAEFDRDFFESEVSEESQTIVDEYLKKGIFKEDQGAVGCDLSDYKLGFMLARKRDGNTLYATKDLALARRKFDEFKIDRNIYVVASEQNHHFRQVFKTLELMGFEKANRCFHLSYGMVVLPDGKMSSRAGNTVPFMALKDAMLKELHLILQKYSGEWATDEIDDTAKRLCVGAVKYGMLQADPAREIVFDMKDWLSFEGNTGPYLMYSYARTMSIVRKAADAGHKAWTADESKREAFQLAETSEAELLRYIYDFNTVVQDATEQCRPSHLTTHLYYMCKAFNRFYSDVPILKASSEQIIRMRLTLILAFALTLKQGLGLLGITPPERM